MTLHYDEDGDCITLTEDDREYILAEIKALDAELLDCIDQQRRQELTHLGRHLADELAKGRRLPLCDI
jgi:hypothetical protein